MTPVQQARAVARCRRFDQQLYCLDVGFSDSKPDYAKLLQQSDDGNVKGSGDQSFAAWVHQRVHMPTKGRRAEERREFAQARAGADKAAAVAIAKERIDAGKPVASIDSAAAARAEPKSGLHPRTRHSKFIMGGSYTQQVNDHYCGPATFQMMDWADDGSKNAQSVWASRQWLKTDYQGATAIPDMVRTTNAKTKWDNAAGDYIVQNISNWSPSDFIGEHVAHLNDGSPAPIIEHPKLSTRYFWYLRYSGHGHFQVGRGYYKHQNQQVWRIAIFEPWNEDRFWHDGNVTWGPQGVPSYKMLRATKHNQNTIGL